MPNFFGGTGNDSFVGDGTNETIYGGDGNDTLRGEAGADTLYGGEGNDRIDGGIDNDFMYGGAGSDTFLANFGTNEGYFGGAGNDVYQIAGTPVNGFAYNVNLEAGNDQFSRVFAGIETVLGGDGADTLTGRNDTAELLDGGGGSDQIYGGGGGDTLYGGVGDDTVQGGAGDDTVQGGDGNDVIYGDDGSPQRITNGDFSAGATGWTLNNPSGGAAPLVYTAGVPASPAMSFNNNEEAVFGDSIQQTFSTTVGEVYDVALNLYENGGGNAAHTMVVEVLNAAGVVISTQTYVVGNDAVLNPTFVFTATSATSTLRITNTTSTSTTLSDVMVDNVSVIGRLPPASGNDVLYGGAGTDRIYGGGGNDFIDGGTSIDTLFGGLGDDVFIMGNSFGNDTVYGGEGDELLGDMLDFSTIDVGINIQMSAPETGTAAATVSTATFFEVERFNLTNFNDTFVGAASNDVVYGGLGNDTLTGNGGADQLYGGAGLDQLFGGDGNDLIDAGAGNDLVNYGAGDDTVYGGDGDDVIDDAGGVVTLTGNNLVYGGGGNDRIWDSSGNDTYYGGDGNDSLTGEHNSDDVFFGDAGDDSIEGAGGNDRLFGGDGADRVFGGTGRDTLDGGAGNDFMVGGAGADVFVASGADTITDFDAVTGISVNGNLDNDFVDLTAFYNATTLAAWNAANPGNQYDNALKWMQADQADGILQSAEGLRILNGGVAVSGALLNNENTAVCFTAGTRIATAKGHRRIENLRVGDLVETADHGLQPIRWIGSMTVDAMGEQAPILITAGALGNRRDIMVSPLHRMLVSGWQVELMFGEDEVIAAAKMLVNHRTIRANPMPFVTYFHILFDAHEIVFAEGAGAESFHPGEEGFDALGMAAQEQIIALMPQLAGGNFAAYGPSARRALRLHEARLLQMGSKLENTGQMQTAPRKKGCGGAIRGAAMTQRLAGKVAIISGGASGCGAAAARLFANEGAAVGIIDRNAELGAALALELTGQGHKAAFAAADVAKKAQVDSAVATLQTALGDASVLFNHAGTIVIKPFLETEEEDWDFLFDVNVKSMYLVTRAVLPQMLRAGKGAIVCTSSISAVYATPNEVLYDATKGACHMFARAIAVEFRDRGIRCNAVCPGFIDTPHGQREVKELTALGVDVSDAAIKAAQGRFGQPEDIARAALYLASDEASFVNGAQLFVDGGFSAV